MLSSPISLLTKASGVLMSVSLNTWTVSAKLATQDCGMAVGQWSAEPKEIDHIMAPGGTGDARTISFFVIFDLPVRRQMFLYPT